MAELELLRTVAQSPKILHEIYGDLAKPGVKQVGLALAAVLGLGNTILWPVGVLNERARIALEANLEKYRKKMKGVSEEEVCEVAPEIGVPIAEKLSYVTNEKLSEMYVELLAKASHIQNANTAHPSFVNIINNISPDEAIMLKSIRPLRGVPYISVRLQKKDKNEWNTLHPMMLNLSCLAELTYPGNSAAYLSNLEGLGVLDILSDIFMIGEGIYEPIEEKANNNFASFTKNIPDRELVFKRGKIELTSFGHLFLQACFSSE